MGRWGAGAVSTAWFLAVLAGCLGSDAGVGKPGDGVAEGPKLDLELVPPTGAAAYQLLYDFAMGHPNRHAGFPDALEAARSYLREELAARTLDVVDHVYSPTGTNLLGFQWGKTRPEEWVVLGCHYDVIETTIYGARDDGLGCAALLEMAGSFATREWNRTLVYAFFDEEEQGLLGSAAFVRDHHGKGNGSIVANLNFDPAGLHWPCGDALGPYKILLMITESKVRGADAVSGYPSLLEAVRSGFNVSGAPPDVVEVRDHHAYARLGATELLPPRSDDDSFDAVDVPSIWVGAPPLDEAAGLAAWGYPNHTPPDTAQLVELRCGSPDLLERGLQVSLDATTHALAALDATTWDA